MNTAPPPLTATPFPTVPISTPTPIPALPPMPSRMPAEPSERQVELDTPFEAIFIPGQPPEIYRFEADRALRIAVDIRAGDDGPPLKIEANVYNAAGELLPRVRAPLGQPLLRDEWDLPGPGMYRVELFGGETETRALRLTIIRRPLPAVGGGAIASGEVMSGAIAVAGQRDRWIFQGRAGDHVLITMIAASGDAYLELYDPAGRLIATNDDSERLGRHAALDLVLSVDGEHAIVARMVDDDQTGAYRLSLERLP